MTGPIGEPPLDALPPDAPATVEDVRASRRWTIVALAWAIAASAIAAIALVQASKDNSNDNQPTQTTQSVSPKQLQDSERQTKDRLDAFSGRLNDRAAEADVQKLDKRLSQVEDDFSRLKDDSGKQSDTITQLQSDLKDLQQRVDELESQQQSQNTTP
ncbi:MAG TPA: hypothetical protein VF066_01410 [Thermoleophilaceae bacterium]